MPEKRTPAPGGNRERAAVIKTREDNTAALPEKPDLDTFAEQLELIADNDREWFERHPHTRWRIRPAMPGETPGVSMAVRSFGPARLRFEIAVWIPPRLTDRGLDRFMLAILSPRQAELLGELEAIMRTVRP